MFIVFFLNIFINYLCTLHCGYNACDILLHKVNNYYYRDRWKKTQELNPTILTKPFCFNNVFFLSGDDMTSVPSTSYYDNKTCRVRFRKAYIEVYHIYIYILFVGNK